METEPTPPKRRLSRVLPVGGVVVIAVLAAGTLLSGSGALGMNFFAGLLFLLLIPFQIPFTHRTQGAALLFALSTFPLVTSLIGYAIDRRHGRYPEDSAPFSLVTSVLVMVMLVVVSLGSLAVGQSDMWNPPREIKGGSFNLVADDMGRTPEEMCRKLLERKWDLQRCTSVVEPHYDPKSRFTGICVVSCK